MSAMQEEVVMPHPKALIVDDSKLACFVLGRMLKRQGFETSNSRTRRSRRSNRCSVNNASRSARNSWWGTDQLTYFYSVSGNHKQNISANISRSEDRLHIFGRSSSTCVAPAQYLE